MKNRTKEDPFFPGTFLQLTMPTMLRDIFLRRSHKPTSAHAKPKVDQDNNDKTNTNDRRSPALVVNALDVATLADLVDAPDVQEETVDESAGGEDGEGPSGDEGCGVGAEVEESCGNAAEDDGEFEPGEEGSLGGEVDFWFHADGNEDACFVVSLGCLCYACVE
jgi:hypothetical protein